MKEEIKTFANYLLQYNKKINLVSRNMSRDELYQLINESILIDQYISNDCIIDAGSGNGILGIPLALINENKKITLVEPKKKKNLFLKSIKKKMNLSNLNIYEKSIEEFIYSLKNSDNNKRTIIVRGFPRIEIFPIFIKKKLITEVILITSENKIKKNKKSLESVEKKIYNIPLRNSLKILKLNPVMENYKSE